MKEKQWVQHISGQGEKWEIQAFQDPEWPSWVAPHTVAGGGLLYLPKSEYRLCDPPERWVDVTERIEPSSTPGNWRDSQLQCTVLGVDESSYRLRKVEVNMIGPGVPYGCAKQWAFIVEQKVNP